MDIETFLQQLPKDQCSLVEQLMAVIEKKDPKLSKGVVQLMGKEMVGYKQEGEFKYGFASYEKHLSVHNMVMYCYPNLHKEYCKKFDKVTFQKSCLTIKECQNFSVPTFERLIKDSAALQYPSELQLKRRK